MFFLTLWERKLACLVLLGCMANPVLEVQLVFQFLFETIRELAGAPIPSALILTM
jgi:hypothetical protein